MNNIGANKLKKLNKLESSKKKIKISFSKIDPTANNNTPTKINKNFFFIVVRLNVIIIFFLYKFLK